MNTKTISERVFEEQILLLFTRSPVRPLLHLIPGTIIYWIIIDFTDVISARSWLLVLAGINIIRYIHIKVIRKKISATTDFNKLALQFSIGSGLVGFTYGIGLAWFMPALPEILQLAILAVSITVIPGAMVSYSSSKSCFYSYLFPKLGIPMMLCLIWGDTFHMYIFYYGLVYLLVLITLFNWYYSALSDTIRIRLQNNELLESLREYNKQLAALSTIDGLTGVANRRHFDDLLDKEISRARRESQPLSLLMLDIDFFKEYNDEYGHLKGDECLQTISQALQKLAKRPSDIVARYGGEEFCIILPNTDQAGALQFARDIQHNMEQLGIYHGNSPISSHVTVSVGIATSMLPVETTARPLLQAADKALYQAKNQGRNMIMSAGSDPDMDQDVTDRDVV